MSQHLMILHDPRLIVLELHMIVAFQMGVKDGSEWHAIANLRRDYIVPTPRLQELGILKTKAK